MTIHDIAGAPLADHLPHHDKLALLEGDILRHCDHASFYTQLLLMRLREDRLWRRKPALFASRLEHWVGYILPLAVLNTVMALVLRDAAATAAHFMMGINLLLLPVYFVAAMLDWRGLAKARRLMRLPETFAEYPMLQRSLGA